VRYCPFAGCSQTGSADKLPLVKTVIGLFATTARLSIE
jgi:hypothetical protein